LGVWEVIEFLVVTKLSKVLSNDIGFRDDGGLSVVIKPSRHFQGGCISVDVLPVVRGAFLRGSLV